MRILTVFILLFISALARAQPPFEPCPMVSAGWSIQFANSPITSAQYDQAAQILYVIFQGTIATAFAAVPFTVMQSLQYTTNPVLFYNSYLVPSYHALFLIQKNNCPLQFESGGLLWTD